MTYLKNKIKKIVLGIKSEVKIPEYIFWWIMRACMVLAICKTSGIQQMLFGLDVLASFAIPLLRLLSPEKSFFHRVSFHNQTVITFTAWVGYFLTHYEAIDLAHHIHKWDFILHLFSGVTVTVMGYFFMKGIVGNRECPKSMIVVGSAGFSFLGIVLWEIMEFLADFFLGSCNQAYDWVEKDDKVNLFSAIFGEPNDPMQYPVVDTNADMIFAAVTTIITAVVIWFIIKDKKEKKA